MLVGEAAEVTEDEAERPCLHQFSMYEVWEIQNGMSKMVILINYESYCRPILVSFSLTLTKHAKPVYPYL